MVGELDEGMKARFMSSVDVYCAPNLGGESFGIVLVEAMAAGVAVVASNLTAFRDVAMDSDGEMCVALHTVGDSVELAARVIALIDDPQARRDLAARGQERSGTFDWRQVAPRIEETYRDAIRMEAEFHPHPTKDASA